MRKLIFFSLLIFCCKFFYGQSDERYVKEGNREGLNMETSSFYSKKTMLLLIKKFEMDLKKTNNDYPDYYRLYWGEGKKNDVYLHIFFIPKSNDKYPIISEDKLDKKHPTLYYYPNRKIKFSKTTMDYIPIRI
ncbi:hypothetical protein EH151_10585 [Elizabethkingia anophelis]|uniref:hypothetical protein n=1 Tax=Elizabethkingia anophelis TaxID=1117645 RepID=UPI0013697C84|nr:hypothetical protein [Elizabethkingia anophelis]MYZ60332.1 hypothetical protein [Elizabethkingia anophelis]